MPPIGVKIDGRGLLALAMQMKLVIPTAQRTFTQPTTCLQVRTALPTDLRSTSRRSGGPTNGTWSAAVKSWHAVAVAFSCFRAIVRFVLLVPRGFAPYVIRLRALRLPTCPLSEPLAVAWRARVSPPAVSRVRALTDAAWRKRDSAYAEPFSRPKRADARMKIFACLVGPTFVRSGACGLRFPAARRVRVTRTKARKRRASYGRMSPAAKSWAAIHRVHIMEPSSTNRGSLK
jgi:hypothetical protein